METVIMKIKAKPYKGKWCSRRVANKVNDFLSALQRPNRDALNREANEYFEALKRSCDKMK